MKRILTLLSVVLLAHAASYPYQATASRPERNIVLRVRSADSIKPLKFSGWYQPGESDARVQVTQRSAAWGVKLTTNSLRATFRKQSGESEMCVEVIEFSGENEKGYVTGTGDNLEVSVDSSGSECRMTVRPVSRS